MASQSSPSVRNHKVPLVPPPPGVVYNLINPASRAYQIHVVSSVFLALMVVFVAIRIYAKWVLQKTRTWDDYVCLAGMGGIISFVALTITEVKRGYGRHVWEASAEDFSDQLQMEMVFTIAIYNIVILLVKLTILMLLSQIFGLIRWMKICIWIGVIVASLWYLSEVIVAFCLCGPSRGLNWLQISQTAPCRRLETYRIPRGGFNILSDFYLLIIPIPAVWSLQMQTRRKAGVCAIFMTGLFACIMSCVSLWFRRHGLNQYDMTWSIISLWISLIVEMNVGLIVACMPAFATVVRYHGFPLGTVWTFIGSKMCTFSTKISTSRKV